MAEKKKFKIPTAEEIEGSCPSSGSSVSGSVNSFNKFQQLKKQGKIKDARDLDISQRSEVRPGTSTSGTPGSDTQPGSHFSGLTWSEFRSKPVLAEETKTKEVKMGSKNSEVKEVSSLQGAKNVAMGISKDEIKTKTNLVSGASTTKESTSSTCGNTATSEKTVPIALKSLNSNSLIVNPRQRGNPILKFIRSVPYEFGEIIPDYEMGKTSCALFLSLRYHQLNPNYIHERLKQLRRYYDLRVILVQVDVKEPHHLVKDLAKICILADCTLILAFSAEEAGRYLETYKVYEHKPPDAIMEKTEKDYISKVTECFTSVRSVNKTDAMTLLSTFHTVEGILKATTEDLSLCPGFGPQKAKRAFDLFNEPFLKSKKAKNV